MLTSNGKDLDSNVNNIYIETSNRRLTYASERKMTVAEHVYATVPKAKRGNEQDETSRCSWKKHEAKDVHIILRSH